MLYCQVYHYIYPPVELESTDEPIEGTIIFTPDIRRGEVWIENNTVVPAVPIRCDVVNGVMRFGGRDGSRFAKLMAGGPGVNPEKVHWRVSFHDMHMGEDYFKINPFIFEAVPNTTINLAEVTPVSGYTPEGVIQGPKGEPGGAATTFYGDEDPIDPLEGDTWFIPGKNGLPDEIRLYMGGEWVTIVSEEYWKVVDDKLAQSEFDLTDPEGKLAKVAEKAQTDLQTLDQKLYGSDGSLTILSEKAQDAWNKAVEAGNANLVEVIYEYQQGNSDTVVPTGAWTLDPPTKDSTKFLWRRDTLKYGNGDVEIRPPYPVTGPKGEPGSSGSSGADGVGVSNTVINYQLGSSPTTAPTGQWSTSIPNAQAGDYVWTRVVWTYTDGTSKPSYSVAKIGEKGDQGPKGSDGAKGDRGVSLTSITPYFTLATSTPAKPTVASPYGWRTTEPGYSVNNNLYRSDKVVFSDNSFSWSAVTLVQSYQVAVQALESANGKNTINTSTATTPSKNGTTVGDIWWRVDSSNNVLAQWMWNGSSWKAQQIESEVIASLDVNKLTVSSSAKMNEAVIDKIWANGIAAKSITASRLTVSGGNIFPDPHFRDPCWDNSGQTERSNYNRGELRIIASGKQVGSYYQPAGATYNRSIEVEPNSAYRISSSIYAHGGTNNVSVYMRYVTKDGDTRIHFVGWFGNLREGTDTYSITIKTPADMDDGSCTFGFYLEDTQKTGGASLWNTRIVRAADGELIVDGSITTDKINTLDITAQKFTMGEGFVKSAHIESLDAGKISTGTINVNRIRNIDTANLANGAVSVDKLGNTTLEQGLGKWNQSIQITPTMIKWKKGGATIGTVAANGLSFYSDTGVLISSLVSSKLVYRTSNESVDVQNIVLDATDSVFAVSYPDTSPNPPLPNRTMFEVHNQGDGALILEGVDRGGIRTNGDVFIHMDPAVGSVLQLFYQVNKLTDFMNHFVFKGSTPNRNYRMSQLELMQVPVDWK